MSKLLTFLFFAVLFVVLGGFVYLAVVDVPIAQNEVQKETTLDALKKSVDSNE